jgi:hypothetical protein
MLADDAGILHRHVPAAEIHHFGAEAAMDRMQRGPVELRRRGRGHKYFLCNSGEKFKLARAAEKCQESRADDTEAASSPRWIVFASEGDNRSNPTLNCRDGARI